MFLARTQLDWKLQTLIEVYTNFTTIFPSVVSYVGSWTTEITGPELLVITSQWKCPQRNFSTLTRCYELNPVTRETHGDALIHISKGNIKSFLGVIPHVNMSWIYLYMIKSFIEFTVHNFLSCMWHLPGSTGQAANYSNIICTYLPSLLPTTLVICYPRMGWPSSRMGWPYNYIGRILLMLVYVFTSRCTSIPKTCCF